MPENFPFARESVPGSWWANRIQSILSAAETHLRLTQKSSTAIQVVPDTALEIAAVSVDGRWRYIEEAINRDHPGGAEGTYTVWAVATDNEIDDTPDPHTDHTDYAFDLRITSGANPSGTGVEIFEKIGEIDWSGSAITAVRQTLNAVTGPMIADGALSGSGDLTWTREASGAWVPDINAKTIGATEIADTLKPSGGAAAGTEALRALGTSSSTAAAGNDARLSDERTPKDNSVKSSKIEDGSIALADLAAALGLNEGRIADKAVTSRKLKPTAGVVVMSGGKIEISENFADVPGSSEVITLATKSLVIVNAAFLFKPLQTSASFQIVQCFGRINIDGTDRIGEGEGETGQEVEAWYDPDEHTESAAFTAACKLAIELDAGEHTIKLRSKHAGSGDRAELFPKGTGYDYVAYAV